MTALSSAQEYEHKQTDIVAYPVLAWQKIYKGAPVVLHRTSKLAMTNDWTTVSLTNTDLFVWIAKETVDNTDWANWDVVIRVVREWMVLLPISNTVTQASVWLPVFVNNVTDNSVFTVTSDSTQPQATVWVLHQRVWANSAYVILGTTPFAVAAWA